MKNLIYTIAFDKPEQTLHQMMAKMLISSIFRCDFSGDVLLFTNSPQRLFEIERPRLTEVGLDTSEIAADLGASAQRFKFGARDFFDDHGKYEKIMFVDCDCLFQKNPDSLFAGEEDVKFSEEPFTEITGTYCNAYLSDQELLELDAPGVNSGVLWVREHHFDEVLEEWRRIDSAPPIRTKIGDQPAWTRFLLDTSLSVGPFAFGEEIHYPFFEKRTALEGGNATLLHFNGIGATQKVNHMFSYFTRRFQPQIAPAILSLMEA